jgi:hypothetical protein
MSKGATKVVRQGRFVLIGVAVALSLLVPAATTDAILPVTCVYAGKNYSVGACVYAGPNCYPTCTASGQWSACSYSPCS